MTNSKNAEKKTEQRPLSFNESTINQQGIIFMIFINKNAMRKTRRTTTEPFTPQNLPGTAPVIDLNKESDKRLDEKTTTEEAFNNVPLKGDVQQQIKNRKPGDDVDPDQSINNE
jgi:hypothetical protein